MSVNYLVIDIGGSSIKYAWMGRDLTIFEKKTVPVPLTCLEDLIEAIGHIYDSYKDKIEGIAISMPGMINSDRGFCFTGGTLEYIKNIDFRSILQRRCPTKISLENDGKCVALAELWKGNLRSCTNGIVVVLGTGVGGGIIINRKLYKGSHFSAGEFSFHNTNRHDFHDTKNMWGFISGASALREKVAAALHLQNEFIDGKQIFQMANEGHEEVLACLNEFTHDLAVQLFNLQCMFDPEVIAIGGGISAQPLLLEYTKKNLGKLYRRFPFFIPMKVVACKYYNDSNLIGALYHHLTHYNKAVV